MTDSTDQKCKIPVRVQCTSACVNGKDRMAVAGDTFPARGVAHNHVGCPKMRSNGITWHCQREVARLSSCTFTYCTYIWTIKYKGNQEELQNDGEQLPLRR